MISGISKKILRRYLYRFRVPVTYRNAMAAVSACLKDDKTAIPRGVRAEDLLGIKRALETYSKQEGTISQAAVEAEVALLEMAAEFGDPSAIALLCGERLSDPNVSKQDFADGSRLLRELMDGGFPLAYKVSGDLAYKMGVTDKARRFYELAVEKGLSDNMLSTECLRNVGHIAFKTGDLFGAREFFSRACEQAEDLKQVADCHFYLAQLREANREAMRAHLQVAAGAGLSDAFVPLGMALLNYFGDPKLAKKWLQLGLVTDQTGTAAVGMLDTSMRLGDLDLAKKMLARIRLDKNAEALLAGREDVVAKLQVLSTASSKSEPESPRATTVSVDSRWNF